MPLYDNEKIEAAINLVGKKKPGNTEDYVTRYAVMILLLFFNINTWNMVPKILTQAKKFPDIAFERFRTRSDKTKHFVTTVWVELKSYVNMSPKQAIEQLLESIRVKHGRKV